MTWKIISVEDENEVLPEAYDIRSDILTKIIARIYISDEASRRGNIKKLCLENRSPGEKCAHR